MGGFGGNGTWGWRRREMRIFLVENTMGQLLCIKKIYAILEVLTGPLSETVLLDYGRGGYGNSYGDWITI